MKKLIAAALAALTVAPASATVVVDHLIANQNNAWCTPCSGVRDHNGAWAAFTLGADATLDVAHLQVWTVGDLAPVAVGLTFYQSDLVTQRGSVTRMIADITQTYLGSQFADGRYHLWQYDVALPGLALGAGSYVMGLHGFGVDEFYWGARDGIPGNDFQTADTGPSGFVSTGGLYLGYSLEDNAVADAIPEPAMLALFGIGALGLGLLRRRATGAS